MAAGGAAGVQQVGLLQRQRPDDVPVAVVELAVVVVAQLANGLDPGAQRSLGGGAACLPVVVAGEKLAQVPRQRRVDGVVGAAQVGQQAGLQGAVQQAGYLLFGFARQLGQGVVAFAHPVEGVHIHRALEQV